ncbi:MAG: hypothetical protein K0R73_1259 [Candidatus Midichloriaceae bacterium]|nr:hypothetical protein [Candidatus Midichloriaceae bacterium]
MKKDDLNTVIKVLSQGDAMNNPQDTKVRLEYTAFLNALGETIGCLQRYDRFPCVKKLDCEVIDEKFNDLELFVPDIREFRNTRTHNGHFPEARCRRIIEAIKNKDIIKQMDEFSEILKLKWKELNLLNSDEFDTIIQSSKVPQLDKDKNAQCNLW